MAKGLNSLQLQAVELLARGIGEIEVANACGKSRSWVQALKRREDFQEAIEAAKHRVGQVIAEETTKAVVSDLEEFRNRLNNATNLLYKTATKYVEKLNQKIDELDIQEISPSRLSQSLKSGADTLVISLELNKSSLGLDEVMKELDGIEKLNKTGINYNNKHQSLSTGFETN